MNDVTSRNNGYNGPYGPQLNAVAPSLPLGSSTATKARNGFNMAPQTAIVYIDLAELMTTYVNGCKQMFELGIMAGKMAKNGYPNDKSADQADAHNS